MPVGSERDVRNAQGVWEAISALILKWDHICIFLGKTNNTLRIWHIHQSDASRLVDGQLRHSAIVWSLCLLGAFSSSCVTDTPHRGMQRAQLLVRLTAVENSSNERLRRPAAVMAAYQFPLYAE
ncbi:hypothetical protein D9C73_015786 [Collichthys lucidus]|uniref:Uncharacterized protein n=1 Tax=Collichthys lucidus TaxID=240159 RepID=A0A4U5V3D3_COLLU|nr:hypothetical protein D9C73_015786 [Collichthys lucidus]